MHEIGDYDTIAVGKTETISTEMDSI